MMPFIFLALAMVSIWIRRDIRLWGSLLAFSVVLGAFQGMLTTAGLMVIAGWVGLWVIYSAQKKGWSHALFFFLIVLLSFGFKFHLFPGMQDLGITGRLQLHWGTPLLGLLPLALVVALAKTVRDWWVGVFPGVLLGCAGIVFIAFLATMWGVVHWDYKVPSAAWVRYLNNFFLVAIPEEAFYRGFLQEQLTGYLRSKRGGKVLAVVLTSLVFTFAHLYWSPSVDVLGFVFLASLLYGGVYLVSGRIESAIITHFLLNAIHMTAFSYHDL